MQATLHLLVLLILDFAYSKCKKSSITYNWSLKTDFVKKRNT